MRKYCLSVFVLWALLVISVHGLYASPSGLNNIATTDVTPEKVLVFQAWVNAGHEKLPEWYSGFKCGVIKGLEIGFDGKTGSRDAGPGAFQVKYQLADAFGDKFKLLVGFANISSNKNKRLGKLDPYVVCSYQMEPFRVHLGYSFQEDNHAVFAGVDKTFPLFKRDFTLRSDIRQTKDGDEALGSFGYVYALPWNFVWENWVSFPSEKNVRESFTFKLDYVITF